MIKHKLFHNPLVYLFIKLDTNDVSQPTLIIALGSLFRFSFPKHILCRYPSSSEHTYKILYLDFYLITYHLF